jgi:hypothetical protein
MTQSELAEMVPCDTATVSRVENGVTFPPDDAFARTCSAAFGNEWFLRFWKDSQTWGAAVFPQSLREFAAYEAEAVTLWLCEHSVLPGLLQVEPYARAVLESHPDTDSEQAAQRAAARIARQTVLERSRPPRVWALIDEGALYREVAAPKVMAGQMVRLAELARRPAVSPAQLPRVCWSQKSCWNQ